MPTRFKSAGAIALVAALTLCTDVRGGDGEEAAKPNDKAEQTSRVVVRDLRGAEPCSYGLYGDYYSRSPDEARRLIEETYRARRRILELERQRRFNEADMAQRGQRLLTKHEQALSAGLQRLKAGEPERAVVALTLAAKLNQGDPACRIHLAQSRLALGHYREAGLALRRALQLQPKLVYFDLHLDRFYQKLGELDKHTDRLHEWLEKNPESPPEIRFLLGFLEFQRGEFAAAHEEFARVRKALPKDDLTRDLFEVTKPPTTIAKED
jgi:tetratricopeptide (TPR) repeat protein